MTHHLTPDAYTDRAFLEALRTEAYRLFAYWRGVALDEETGGGLLGRESGRRYRRVALDYLGVKINALCLIDALDGRYDDADEAADELDHHLKAVGDTILSTVGRVGRKEAA